MSPKPNLVAWRRWGLLLAFSTLLATLTSLARLPASVLIGCMVAAIVVAVRLGPLHVPRRVFGWGQGLLGCLMAQSLQPERLGALMHDWPLFVSATLALIAASAWLGWWMMRRGVMPGTTAVWGMAPGAASAMVLMAQAHGADMRLVAFMQYTRVVVVTALAALVARAAGADLGGAPPGPAWFAVRDAAHLGATLALVGLGTWAARRWSIAGGAMVIPLVVAALLQAGWGLRLDLPPALLVGAYAAIGWSVGLRFTPDILRHALRALPTVLGAIAALVGVGLLLAGVLMWGSGLDALSAYLATSPGGADSMAVIAATSAVETSFVMAMQLARFLMVLVLGPRVTRWVAQRGAVQSKMSNEL